MSEKLGIVRLKSRVMLSSGLRGDIVRLSEDQNVTATSGDLIAITLHQFEVWNELSRMLKAR